MPRYITPPAAAGDTTCRSLTIPYDMLWLGVFNKALLDLANVYHWEQNDPGYLTPAEAAAACYQIFEDYLASDSSCATVPAPYWDLPARADDMLAPAEQIWYGSAVEELAPLEPGDITFVQQLGIWGITAFIAYSGQLGAAVAFSTFAPRFVLAWNTSGVGGAIRVLIDGVDQGLFDTYDPAGGILEQSFYPGEGEHEIIQILESKPVGAPDEPVSAEEAAMQLIRKRLTELETDVVTNLRQVAASGQLEMERAGAWENVPTAVNVRLDGSTTMTEALNVQALTSGIVARFNRSSTGGAIFNIGGWNSDNINAVRAAITASLIDSAVATFKSRVALTVRGAAGGVAEVWRGDYVSNGVPALGALGHAAVIRQIVTGERQQNAALLSLLAAMVNFGFITDNSTAGTLPVGPEGPAGPEGPTGPEGPEGPTGPIGPPANTPIQDLPDVGSIPEGECVDYDLVLDARQQLILPVVLQSGYTIQITALAGAATDQQIDIDEGFPVTIFPEWYCPTGELYVLGGCGAAAPFVGSDPMTAARHMVLLASVNGALFDCSGEPTLEVGLGVTDVLCVFQLNDSVLNDNQGTITFHVQVCNPADACENYSDGMTTALGPQTYIVGSNTTDISEFPDVEGHQGDYVTTGGATGGGYVAGEALPVNTNTAVVLIDLLLECTVVELSFMRLVSAAALNESFISFFREDHTRVGFADGFDLLPTGWQGVVYAGAPVAQVRYVMLYVWCGNAANCGIDDVTIEVS